MHYAYNYQCNDPCDMFDSSCRSSIEVRLRGDVSEGSDGSQQHYDSNGNRGVLEMNIDWGGWAPVCDDYFDNDAANAFCREMGYPGGTWYTVQAPGLREDCSPNCSSSNNDDLSWRGNGKICEGKKLPPARLISLISICVCAQGTVTAIRTAKATWPALNATTTGKRFLAVAREA